MKLYGGIRYGDTAIGVTQLPDRKNPCLYCQEGSVLYPLAYFKNEECADKFWEQLQRMVYRQTDCQWK